MRQIVTLLQLADTAVVKVTRFGVILGMVTLFILLMLRIIARAAEIPFVAYDEIGELATVWLIMFGVVAMWRQGTLYSVDFQVGTDSRLAQALNLFIHAAMLFFALVLVWQGAKFTAMNRERSAFLLINMKFYYGAIPFAASVLCVYSLRAVWRWLVAIAGGRGASGLHGDGDTDIPSGHL